MPKELDNLINRASEWLKGTGPLSEIVLSSRIRLARNLDKFPFTVRANRAGLQQILDAVKEAVAKAAALRKAQVYDMTGLSELDRQFLVERHLISREHVISPEGRGVVIAHGEAVSLMINEEDHIRLQVLQSGLNLRDAWTLVDTIDDELAASLPFAYLTDWGYLTCCPTNTGTGMRASVMLHLPSLVMTKQINNVLHTITKLGLAARGFYGEGTEASGNFFQISNQVALGRTEDELIENIERILKHARTVSSNEANDLLSVTRLGVDLGLMNGGLDRAGVNELFLFSQPAHLQKLEGKALGAKERDAKRAELIRQRLH